MIMMYFTTPDLYYCAHILLVSTGLCLLYCFELHWNIIYVNFQNRDRIYIDSSSNLAKMKWDRNPFSLLTKSPWVHLILIVSSKNAQKHEPF